MESCKWYINQEREELIVCKQEVYVCEVVCQEKLDQLFWNIVIIKKVEVFYKVSKEKWDVVCVVVVNEREELEVKVVVKEFVVKKIDVDVEDFVKYWE